MVDHLTPLWIVVLCKLPPPCEVVWAGLRTPSGCWKGLVEGHCGLAWCASTRLRKLTGWVFMPSQDSSDCLQRSEMLQAAFSV